MHIEPLNLPDLCKLVWPRNVDERGFFQRYICSRRLSEAGLVSRFVQQSISSNLSKGTLRGMHYQCMPHAETKLLTVLSGEIVDVVVDLREDSPGFGKSVSINLSSDRPESLYIPAGFAHGFFTLTDNVTLLYAMDTEYHPECAAGFHYADSQLALAWPDAPSYISDRDLALPSFTEAMAQTGARQRRSPPAVHD